MDGAVVYSDGADVRIGAGDITAEFREQVAAFMMRIVSHEPARAVPSAREFNWCELGKEYCPERIESGVYR